MDNRMIGKPLLPKTCSSCGALNRCYLDLCSSCGTVLTDNDLNRENMEDDEDAVRIEEFTEEDAERLKDQLDELVE